MTAHGTSPAIWGTGQPHAPRVHTPDVTPCDPTHPSPSLCLISLLTTTTTTGFSGLFSPIALPPCFFLGQTKLSRLSTSATASPVAAKQRNSVASALIHPTSGSLRRFHTHPLAAPLHNTRLPTAILGATSGLCRNQKFMLGCHFTRTSQSIRVLLNQQPSTSIFGSCPRPLVIISELVLSTV